MTDAAAPAAAPAAPAAAPGVTPAPGAAPAAAPVASWRDSLDETLRADPSLANFADVGQLAKGYVETKRVATSRVPAPGDTPESIKAFADAIRPADAAVYEIAVPQGMPQDFADGFRAKAHELGLQPWQVKGIVEWNNGYLEKAGAERAAAEKTAYDKGVADLAEFRKNFQGNWDRKLADIAAWLPKTGLDLPADDQTAMEQKFGSAKVLQFLFAMHDRVGDLPLPPGGGDPQGMAGGLTPAQADAKLTELGKDKEWGRKAMVEGSAEYNEYQRLTRIVTQGRIQQQRNPTPPPR